MYTTPLSTVHLCWTFQTDSFTVQLCQMSLTDLRVCLQPRLTVLPDDPCDFFFSDAAINQKDLLTFKHFDKAPVDLQVVRWKDQSQAEADKLVLFSW